MCNSHHFDFRQWGKVWGKSTFFIANPSTHRALKHIVSDTERDIVQFGTQPFVLSPVFPNLADLTQNFSPWWKNKMAVDRNLLSISMEYAEKT